MDLENSATEPGTGTHWTSYNGRYPFRTGALSPLHLRKTLLRIVLKIIHGLHAVFAVLLEYAKRLTVATTQWTKGSGLRLLESIMGLGLYISRRLRENKLATSLTNLIDFLKPVEIPKCPWGITSVLCHLRLPDGSPVSWRTPYKSFVGTSSPNEGYAATINFFQVLAKTCKGVCPFKWRLWCILGFGTISLDVTDAQMKVRLGHLDDVDADVLIEPFDDEVVRAEAMLRAKSLAQETSGLPKCRPEIHYHSPLCTKILRTTNSFHERPIQDQSRVASVLKRLNNRGFFTKFANSPTTVRLHLESMFLNPDAGIYGNSLYGLGWSKIFDGTMKPFTGLSVQASFKWKHKAELSMAVAPIIIIIVVIWRLLSGDWGTAFTLGTLLAALYPMLHNRATYS